MIDDLLQARADAAKLLERIRACWRARRLAQLFSWSWEHRFIRIPATPPSGPFAALATPSVPDAGP